MTEKQRVWHKTHAVLHDLESPKNAEIMEGSVNFQVGLDKGQEILRLHTGRTK